MRLFNRNPIITPWVAFTLDIDGSTTDPTQGTNTTNAFWRRVGDSIDVNVSYEQTGAGTAGSGTYLFRLPQGLTLDASRGYASTDIHTGLVGNACVNSANWGYCKMYDQTGIALVIGDEAAAAQYVGSGFAGLSSATRNYGFEAKGIPVIGFNT